MNCAAELDAYFERLAARCPGRDLNLLARDQARDATEQLSWHPAIEALGGLVLDDPGTSDHHVLARKSPLAGQVLYLSHDGDTRIVFESLAQLLDAAQRATQQECPLSDLHPALSPPCRDQPGLSGFMQALCEDEQGEEMALELIPSLDLQDLELLQRLVGGGNFFLAEAVAVEIGKRPRPDLLLIAEQCRAHDHPQVAKAGSAAVAAIRRA